MKSTVGQGTTFEVRVPIEQAAASPELPTAASA